MKKLCPLLFIAALSLGLGGCVPKAKLVEAETKLAAAETQLAETQTKLADSEAKLAAIEERITTGRQIFTDTKTQNTTLADEVATLKNQVTEANVKNSLLLDGVTALKKQLAEQAEQTKEQTTLWQKELDDTQKLLADAYAKLAQKPPLPVTISFRSRLLHPGYAASFRTQIKKDFPVMVLIKSKSLGTTEQRQLNLSQLMAKELDISVFEGDAITVKHAEYADKTVVCPSGK
ncbi:MAG: hypothetical protein LBK71_08795 [Verrucomicrobiales bacterium]|jgi:hypothetical protein|nr:hypothetical protein [Verrucomicrobiales bacterium]